VQRIPDALQDRFGLGRYFVVPEPQYTQAVRLKIARAPLVVLDRRSVLAAVELDHEASFVAVEIDDIGRDRVLAAELPAAKARLAQHRPQPVFRIGLALPQRAGEAQHLGGQDEGIVVALASLTPDPSPSGRGETTFSHCERVAGSAR
jgi:hypothetical protein